MTKPAAIFIALMVATGCVKPEAPGSAGGFTPPPTPVEIATVEARGMTDRFAALGSIEASEFVIVAAEIGGRIVDLPFEEGTDVRRGQILVRLDPSQLAAEVEHAEAVLANQRATLERMTRMAAQDIASRQSLDDATAGVSMAQATLAVARARLGKTAIAAPFDGVVGSRLVSVGAVVTPGQPITLVAAIDEIKVVFSAPERFLGLLKLGSEVAVATTAWPDHPVTGRIAVVDPALDPATRTVRMTARAANVERRLRPGMSADVSVSIAERPGALTVDAEAVFFEGDQALVYLVNDDGTVARTPLSLGTRRADVVEVVSGLGQGQRVVRAGHQKLYPGAMVAPVDSRPGEAPAGDGATAR